MSWVVGHETGVKTISLIAAPVEIDLNIVSLDYPSEANAGDTITIKAAWELRGCAGCQFSVLIILFDADTGEQLRGDRRDKVYAEHAALTTFQWTMPNRAFRFHVIAWRWSEEGVTP